MIFYSTAGTYQSLAGQSSCLVCPAGSVSQYVTALQGLVGPIECTAWYDIRRTYNDLYWSDTSVLVIKVHALQARFSLV